MSSSKKPLRKRKRQSPSHVGRRLEKLRCGQRSLWDDVDDENSNNNNNEENIPTKSKSSTEQTYIVLTDSDEEKSSSRTQTKPSKSRKKLLKSLDENISSDNDQKPTTTRCPTCLICSILTTLSSYNCCGKHLDLLVHNKTSQQQQHSKHETTQEQWPPQQVMILPMTDELLQRYLSSQEIYHLKPKNSPSTTIRKLSKKTTSTTSEIPDAEPVTKQIRTSPEPESLSLPSSGTAAPADVTFTVITSTSTTLNSFESPNMLDTCQLQQSSDQPIVIDDSQSDTSTTTTTTTAAGSKQKDPWVPISDETDEAIENALSTASQESIVFPPAIARRMPTELMASRLPKIQLKQGRYRYGKPIPEKRTADSTTTTTTNESCSNDISQSASTSLANTSISLSTRPVSSLATIVEDESLVIQSTRPLTEKIPKTTNPLSSSERQDITPEGLSDTVMSCLFAQDELSQQDPIQLTGKSVSNEALVLHPPPPPPPPVVNQVEEPVQTIESQSSQLTNDQSDTQPVISSTTTITTADKLNTTPSRISYRRNPDGSLVSISRPRLSANPQTPTSVLRRKSTDVTPSTTQAK